MEYKQMNYLQEQFTKIFGGGFNMTPRELGAHMCAIGEPHNERWCDEVTAGYNEQQEKIKDSKNERS